MFTSDNYLKLGLVFIGVVDVAVFLLFILFFFRKLQGRILRSRITEDCKPLLPNAGAIDRTHHYFKLALTLTSLLAVVYVFAYLLAATTDIDGFSSWRLDYDSYFLIFHFVFLLLVATIVRRKMWFPASLSFLAVNYHNITTLLYFPLSVTRAVSQDAVLPNDLLSLVTLPVSIVLIMFVLYGNSDGVKPDDLGEKDVIGEAV